MKFLLYSREWKGAAGRREWETCPMSPRLPSLAFQARQGCCCAHLSKMACSRRPLSPLPLLQLRAPGPNRPVEQAAPSHTQASLHLPAHPLHLRQCRVREWHASRRLLHSLPTSKVLPAHHTPSLQLLRDLRYASFLLVSCLSLACPGLTDLCLSETGVTDAGLQFIARGCTHLVSLNLCSCDVTDAGIDVVLEGCSNMEKIFVSDIMGITGWGFRNGKRLTDIVAGECCLNNFAIEKITEGCQELKVLNVSWSENVTLAGWQVLAMSAAKLEILDVRGCECFCEGSLLAIQGGCPSLRYIKLLDDSFLPYPTFQQFQASRPNVQVEFS